jgi:hypothetical protein
VTVSSGNDRLLLADGGWAVVEFGSDTLYLAKAEPFQSVFAGSGIALKGLYREPMTGGPPRRLLSSDVEEQPDVDELPIRVDAELVGAAEALRSATARTVLEDTNRFGRRFN